MLWRLLGNEKCNLRLLVLTMLKEMQEQQPEDTLLFLKMDTK